MISLQDWFTYHRWGTRKQLNHIASLPNEVYEQELKSVFPSIRAVFEHVWLVDYLWLKRMQGNESPEAIEPPLHSIEVALEKFNSLHDETAKFLESIEDTELKRTFVTMKGIPMENTIEEMVYTVVNHGSYHRGNVTAMHRQLGYAGMPYDYIYYLQELKKSCSLEEKKN